MLDGLRRDLTGLADIVRSHRPKVGCGLGGWLNHPVSDFIGALPNLRFVFADGRDEKALAVEGGRHRLATIPASFLGGDGSSGP